VTEGLGGGPHAGEPSVSAPTAAAAPDPHPAGGNSPAVTLLELPVGSIAVNPRQPRRVFDEDALDELAASISEVGLLQPIVVRPQPESEPTEASAWQLVAGERRLRCVRSLGWDTVPALVRHTPDNVLLRDALVENLQRAQLNPLEEAAAYAQLLEDFGCTQDELALRVGRSRPQVTNTLRLLRLPAGVQRRVAAGVLSQGHARALLALPDHESMERLAGRIVAEGLSVRSVEEIVTLGGVDPDAEAPRRRNRTRASHPDLADTAQALSDQLDTRVSVTMGRSKGKVTIEFAGREDLSRILKLISEGGPTT
jgi:ParB family chromosome partitioning protein